MSLEDREKFGTANRQGVDDGEADFLNGLWDDVVAEVERQQKMWGTEFDDLNTANDWCAYICRYVSDGVYVGSEGKDLTPKRFFETMKKVIAMAVSAILAAERANGLPAARHYEK